MKLPRHTGPLRAKPGQYYFARVLREVRDRPVGTASMLTLLPNTIFVCKRIVNRGQRVFAHFVTHPHEAEFYLQISGADLMPAGYDPLNSPLILLAAQADDLG